MEFQVNTNNVILSQIDQVESGEYNVTECNFTFSSEFDGLTKKAVFTGEDGTAYLQTIVDNKCSIPSEILEVSQVVEIGVYAYDVENEELLLRYSPEPTQFYIHQGSYKEAQNSTPPTPSEVEQLQAQITSNKNDIEEIQGDIVDINSDIADIKTEQITQNSNIQTNANNISTINGQIITINQDIDNLESTKADKSEIPTKTSDLINDSDFVSDANYVHTDNNFTDEDKAQITTNASNITTLQNTKADRTEIPTKTSQLNNDSGFITKNVDDLANYYKKSETYNKTEIDGKVSSVYKYKGTVATYQDLPSTDLTIGDVYNVEEDGSNYAWTGNSWDKLGGDIDLSEYYTKSQTDSLLSAKANSSDVYTKNETYNKTEVNTLLDGKVDKVEGKGLSTKDFTDAYENQITANQEEIAGIKNGTIINDFGAVETALNSKEDKSNKVTSITDESTDTQYPSAKCVYDELEAKQNEIDNLQQDVEDLRNASYKVPGTGTDITLNNTAQARLLKIELSGRTEQATSILPNEYQQVEYIEADGTQYINTAITSDKTKKLKFETSIMWSSDITTRQNMGGDYGQFFGIRNGVYQIGIEDTTIVPSTNKFDKIIAEFDMPNNNGFINVNGTTKNFTRTNWVNILLYLFGLKIENDVLPRYFSKCKMKYFRIYKGNVLAGEFIPCYKISDSTIGMYNTVTNTFLTNAGTGTFLKGNDITLPNPDFPQPIKNVTRNANEKIQNKNLFVAQKIVDDSNNASVYLTQDGFIRYITSTSRCIIKPNIIKENTAYTFKLILKSGVTDNNNIGFTAFYTDGTSVSLSSTVRTNRDEFEQLFTTDASKTLDYLRSNFTSNKETFIKIDGSMILEGSYTAETIPSYVSHAEQNYPFTFAEGQRGMQGTTLQDDGIHNKRYQYIFTGEEDLKKSYAFPGAFYIYFSELINKAPLALQIALCNYAIGVNRTGDYKKGTILFDVNSIGLFLGDSTQFPTIESFKAYLAELYANGTPVIIEYELAEEEIIPYNETQQSQYNDIENARSYDDITYITSTSDELGFNMNVVAVADANKVIDNQNNEIDTIKSRLDLLEG